MLFSYLVVNERDEKLAHNLWSLLSTVGEEEEEQ